MNLFLVAYELHSFDFDTLEVEQRNTKLNDLARSTGVVGTPGTRAATGVQHATVRV